ncbi:uncharacterized protein (UPF0548 family) [Kineococcus xinjiangensis]|uniref:Uncharacterized protein (UPF0548 family) n=1 Tax=Kineococcus xinjiangensis TaxID=512762 RepID=A0A2S6IEF3_9ACTN|nr:DUF1990 domain-containing protein [Kineococcus xinjiangensis]PPK92605.1 uncharacterized protein (UPF0548 family) [Kineococcus xinjiangensis]
MSRRRLADLTPNYSPVGATRPADGHWTQAPPGFRRYERSVLLGSGRERWAAAASAVLAWEVKTRSGFTVVPGPGGRVEAGARHWLVASLGPISLREPVLVVAVVDEPDRCGFSYGTLEGHPVSGEEAFIVHRAPDGGVWLTLRSLTRPGRGAWRAAFPLVLVAQRWYRRRYRRALRGG